ncbi:hypothetical protein J6590_020813 [Homalodisca vitripennis]|nr:hypothetical protein J6590_020813 [Homalodisca vitripennis]
MQWKLLYSRQSEHFTFKCWLPLVAQFELGSNSFECDDANNRTSRESEIIHGNHASKLFFSLTTKLDEAESDDGKGKRREPGCKCRLVRGQHMSVIISGRSHRRSFQTYNYDTELH